MTADILTKNVPAAVFQKHATDIKSGRIDVWREDVELIGKPKRTPQRSIRKSSGDVAVTWWDQEERDQEKDRET